MSDVALRWTDRGLDLVLEDGDLARDAGLATGVLLALFSDARLEDASLLEGADVRGWWAEDAGDRYGSLLWRFERAKTDARSTAEISEAARASLQWLLDENIVERLEVAASIPAFGQLELRVELVRGRARGGAHLWAGTSAYATPFGSGFLELSVA